jgi:leucyl-tRNA synthetase
MHYQHQTIEAKWQQKWEDLQTYKTLESTDKPKYYVLDMFPYPSGAGLHVGHPLGYIASDIVSRYKRHQGFNVLHPIGYDSFGLPAEQYAIQTGQHPAVTTEENITRYEQQLRRLGFSFDWSRQFRTSDASYYQFTQWIFIQLFHSWYNLNTDKAEDIATLIAHFEQQGTANLSAAQNEALDFTAEDWAAFDEHQKQETLQNFRLSYRAETSVNWCPGLGTVLANDEVKDGKSERGGFPVFQKKMMQWSMRITAYSERLLQALDGLDWPEPLKESQRYWIGKSVGAQLRFEVENHTENIEVFTTRPDTIFGATFMVLAPEHPLVAVFTTEAQKAEVEAYQTQTSLKTERDRMADVKTVSGAFTGAYAVNPFSGEQLPVYISDYVLMGYGSGAIMAVPAHDDRDHRFAKHFGINITEVVSGGADIQQEAFASKDGILLNSDFLNGLKVKDAQAKMIAEIEARNLGSAKVNYKQRDAIFSRQRYWGEPIPIYYKNGQAYTLPTSALPLALPEVEKYLPTEDGDPPLGNAKTWAWDEAKQCLADVEAIDNQTIFPLELSTMPGWAGSSWYFLRYMDPHNTEYFTNKTQSDYFGQVDLYIGGSEHATGHLLYARFWNKFLADRGFIAQDEPFQKLINQGMILGQSAFVFRINGSNQFVSKSKAAEFDTQKIPVDISMLEHATDILDTKAFKKWRPEFADATFILEDNGTYLTEREVEKMSKSKYNVVNPDEICEQYGADCLRLYEMFLGPLEQAKPWNTQGLSGVQSFMRKLWRLYFNEAGELNLSDEAPSKAEFKALHQLIQKVEQDLQNASFNTTISSMMICVNELQKINCNKKAILAPLAILISPYAPHMAEELWEIMGHSNSIAFEPFPVFDAQYLQQDEIDYPVSFNGKMRFKMPLSAQLSPKDIEAIVLADARTIQYLDGQALKKIIVVPKKIVNIVS